MSSNSNDTSPQQEWIEGEVMVSKPNGHLCGYVTYQQKEKSSKKTKQVKRGKIKNKKP